VAAGAPLAPWLAASWARSQAHGLALQGRPPGAPHASGAQLAQALEHRRTLLAQAQPVMAFLNEQIGDSGCLVMLADPQGMLLHALGDARFADRAARVALRPGAIWSEQWRGTNAIGTALADGVAVEVHGAEHYLERNGFLTCAAAPISDPQGVLLGVLDISGDRRGYHRHTLGLVRSGARLIEHQLFQARFGSGLQLRLHPQREGLGSVTEGLVALSEDGWLIGATRAALDLLGLRPQAIGALQLETLLGLDWRRLRAGVPQLLAREGGRAAVAASGPRPSGPRLGAGGRAAGRPAGAPGQRRRRRARAAGARAARRRQAHRAAAAGRIGRRQGGAGARRARQQPAPHEALRGAELRGAAGRVDRGRAVRLPAGRLHRRGARGRARASARGRRRHPVPRRDRRHAAAAAGAPAARAAGRRGAAAGRRARAAVDFRLICATHRRWPRRCAPGASAPICTTASTA
jgi:transcriptional regulator of acetoin/glycerol metabolism